MDAELVYKGLAKFAHKRKTWLLVLTGFGLTSYGCYKVYHLPYLTRKRARLRKVLDAFASVVDAISDSADMIGVVSKELKDFVQSDSDEIPNSLNQISKITKSQEFCESVVRVTAALTAGISRGNCPAEIEENSGVCDRVMDKLLSTAGSGFASVVVGSFARNLIMAFFSSDEKPQERLFVSTESNAFEEGSVAKWFNIVCSDKGKMVTGDCIQVFVTTAVAVYLDKTMHINIYDDFFAGLTNPKHEKRVRDLLVSVCNNAIDTVLKASHQVLTTNPSLAPCGMDTVGLTSSTPVMNSGASISSPDENEEYKQGEKLSDEVNQRKLSHHGNNVSWASSISSALSEPSNRRFILNITGQVTFETVRSFLEFLLEKACESLKRSFDIVHDIVIKRVLEAVRYFTLKSFLIATVCISLCLHALFGDAWVLAPAESI